MGRKRRVKRKPSNPNDAKRGPTRRERNLFVVKQDGSFERKLVRGEQVWLGKCLMCGTKVLVSDAGDLLGGATLEHIEPRNHGGTDELDNLAIACARCNHTKGARLDNRRRSDPRRQQVVSQLLARKAARRRNPDNIEM